MKYDDQTDDGTLLRGYCERGDGGAFEILVHRYAGMVCGVAQRVTGQRMLAEEATQNVFASLARKAEQLRSNSDRLPGWLHRAAVLEARHLRRGEKRHEHRVRAAGEQQIAETGDTSQLRAEVDCALDQLPAIDRDVLVLRYYNELSFREIAVRLGKSEAAAQKQGRRALERLGVTLRGVGIGVPATAIATFLCTGLAEAMPATSATKISAAAMASAAGRSAEAAGSLMFPIAKLLLAGGAAAILIGIILHQGSVIAAQRNQVGPAPAGTDSDPAGSRLTALKARDFTADVSFRKADEVDLTALAEDLYRGVRLYDYDRSMRATATLAGLEGLPDADLKALFERGVGVGLSPQRRQLLLGKLAPIVGGRDPQWLFDYCFPKPEDKRAPLLITDSFHGSPLPAVMKLWVERDPIGALDWFEQALDDRRLGTLVASQPVRGAAETIELAICVAAWSKAPHRGEALLLKLPREARRDVLKSLPSRLSDDASLAAFATSDVVQATPSQRTRIFAGIAEKFKDRQWPEVEGFAEKLGGGATGRGFLDRVASRRWRFEPGKVAAGVDAMLNWTEEIRAGDDAGHLVGAALGTQEYLGEDETWAQAKRVAAELGHGEPVIAAYLVHAVGPTNPWRLLKLAVAELTDPELRADVGFAATVYMSTGESFNPTGLEGVGFSEAEIELVRGRFER